MVQKITTEDIRNKSNEWNGSFSQFVDDYRRQASPTPNTLVSEYEGVAYYCVNLISSFISQIPLRLYIKKGRGTKNRFWQTAHVEKGRKLHVAQKLRLSSAFDIEEVVSHPLLELFKNPNPRQTTCQLFSNTDKFISILGTGYWKVTKDNLGRPQEISIMPSHCFKPVYDSESGIFLHFEHRSGRTIQTFGFSDAKTEIIPFPLFNPNSEIEGISPLRAAWEQINIANKMDAQTAAELDNNSRPDFVMSPSGDGFFDDDERLALEAQMMQKFSRGGKGLPFIPKDPVDINVLSFPQKDRAIIEMMGKSHISISLAFGVPPAMLEQKQVSLANLEGARKMLAEQAIAPRITLIEQILNKRLASLYDPSGNLFVAFDDPSVENLLAQQQRLTGYVSAGIQTENEARDELRLPAHPQGDDLIKPMPGMVLPDDKPESDDGKPESETEETTNETPEETKPESENIQGEALNGAQVSSLLSITTQITEGLIPADTGRALISAAFPLLTVQQVENIIEPLLDFEKPQEELPAETPKLIQENNESESGDSADDSKQFTPVMKAKQEFGLPDGKELGETVSKFLISLQKKTIDNLKSVNDITVKMPNEFIEDEDDIKELAEQAQPHIQFYLDEAGKELIQRVGVDPDVWNVTNPLVKEAIEKAAFAFAESTIHTTTESLNVALSNLRESLGDGLNEGERINQLTTRVNEVFENLSSDRAFLIATSEASRSHNAGTKMAAIESGVVKGFRWMLSAEPCEECIAMKDVEIGLTESFGTREASEGTPYHDIPHPPLHPMCRCAIEPVLQDD